MPAAAQRCVSTIGGRRRLQYEQTTNFETAYDNFNEGSGAQGNAGGDAPFGDATGVATVRGMDFGNAMTETTAAKMAGMSSRPNAHFLRRGSRTDLERIHIERLTGKRGPHDWLLAGSKQWVQRKVVLDQQNEELAEMLRMAEQCELTPQMFSWNAAHQCKYFCGRQWPCAGCKDGIFNGDEAGVDCGGSCPPCPTCNDGVMNGVEEGVDCGGSCINPCFTNVTSLDFLNGAGIIGIIAPEPEPDGTDANTAVDHSQCIEGNINCYYVGSMVMPSYYTNPYFPWVAGSVLYNNMNSNLSNSHGRRMLEATQDQDEQSFLGWEGADDGMY